jgi:two-component system, chemotaxis family, CheB/CheR fusion protein
MTTELDVPALRIGVLGAQRPADVETVVRGLPNQLGLAMIVACGDIPDLASTLRPVSALPVVEVSDAAPLHPDHIYIVPPDRHVEVRDGQLVVAGAMHDARLDKLLRSLSDTHGREAAVVLLAGAGADGVLGLKRIKEAGGLTIAQLPDGSGRDEELPRAAIATGMVDLVLPLLEIPDRLSALGQQSAGGLGDATEKSADTMRDILSLVRIRSGHDFALYKRSTLYRRVARRMQVCRCASISEYHRHLRHHPNELANLLRDFLISVTNFFRDPEAWDVLADQVIPKLFLGKTSEDAVRVWVAGCATGEEAYSLGMLLLEHASSLRHPPQLQIFATDIDEDALGEARGGLYPEVISVDVSPQRLDRFFSNDDGHYRIRKELRELMLFSPHNILRDPPFSRLDLVSCRNLMIYLNRDAQDRVLNMFHFGLRTEGYLFLGLSESAEGPAMQFSALDAKQRIYIRSTVPSTLGADSMVTSGYQHVQRAIAPSATPDRALASYGQLHQRMVEQFAPPSVLVNDDLDVVHVSEHAGRFLQIDGGEPTRQITRLVHPALRLDLRTAIHVARQAQPRSDTRVIRFDDDGVARAVELRVRAVDAPDVGRSALLVMFDELRPSEAPVTAAPPTTIEPVVREMEDELRHTRDYLRTTVEQYETSVEELKASNEELQAMNEELRSASEELETSREELQSVNEELTTLNHELTVKVNEVSHANGDLQNLMTSTDIAVVFLDRDLNIKRFTPRAQELFNVIPTDIGRPLAHLTHHLDVHDLVETARAVQDDLRTVERPVATTSGRRYIARVLPYRSVEDRIEGVVMTFLDVTERFAAHEARERAELLRRASEERLRIALRTAPLVVLTFDSALRVVWGFLHGEEVIGQPMAADLFPAGHVERLAAIVRDVARTGKGVHAELDVIVGGKQHTYDFGIEPGTTGVTVVGFDIAVGSLAQAKLRETDRRKDEFLATLSHELRNPLTPLRIALDITQMPNATPEQIAESRRVMSTQVELLTQLVDDLLDLSRITQNKLHLERVAFDPSVMVERAVEAVGATIQVKHQTLQLALAPGTPLVLGDLPRLTQVLVNLLVNASKYTPEGGRIVLALDADTARRVLVVRVRDTGVGIPPDVLPHIFELFVQGRDAEGRSSGGLGIGLNLVKRLVEAHDGRVAVTSTIGSGSEFTVELPLAPG